MLKAGKTRDSLVHIARELQEYNKTKVEGRKLARQRLVQALNMHVAFGEEMASRGVWDLR